ncbi:hypothetical protein [Rhizohabitans arisaemae]|uniref:hypothetical protein n=1 Tax=Rhizohabitans arisaemae TaxID=2720610 RepID=UPI0024B09AF0|nr:hypothetical protein [Rhizohabitans arisaemae]
MKAGFLRRKLILTLTSLTIAFPLSVTSAAFADPDPADRKAAAQSAVRADYLTDRDRDRAVRQGPLIRAAEKIRHLVEAGEDAGYAGIELAEDRVLVWWKGPVPKTIEDAVGKARQIAAVEVKQAAYTRKELKAAGAKAFAATGVKNGGPVHAVRIPFDGSGIGLAVDPKNSSAKARTQSLIPENLGVPVEVFDRTPVGLAGRCDDSRPWYGGMAIRNTKFGGLGCRGTAGSQYNCTAGFGVLYQSRRYLLTAGHCGAYGDTFTDGVGESVGFMEYEHAAYDLALIRTRGSAGRIWDGTPGVNDFSKQVIGWLWTYGGQWLCSSGTTAGARCGFQVDGSYTELCGPDIYGNHECYNDLISAVSHSGQGCYGGDSGGPVFQLDSANVDQVWATGTITGWWRNWLGTDWLLFQDYGTAAHHWGGMNILNS